VTIPLAPSGRGGTLTDYTNPAREIGWNSLDYDTEQITESAPYLRALLRAARDNGLRPLILLNANEGRAGPDATARW
jgi:hypothetical protein